MPDPLQQVCVSLPPSLVALVQQHAAQTDRTIGGMIRHVVSEWARSQPRPETVGFSDAFAPPVPAVQATPEAIAAAKERLAELRDEQVKIRRRKARWEATVSDDARLDRLIAETEVLGKRIAAAERMLPRSSNGG
jgi:hypothetical protein